MQTSINDDWIVEEEGRPFAVLSDKQQCEQYWAKFSVSVVGSRYSINDVSCDEFWDREDFLFYKRSVPEERYEAICRWSEEEKVLCVRFYTEKKRNKIFFYIKQLFARGLRGQI